MNKRRAELIRKKNRGMLPPEEEAEYEHLQKISQEALAKLPVATAHDEKLTTIEARLKGGKMTPNTLDYRKKLWPELTETEQRELVAYWREEGNRHAGDLEKNYFQGQTFLRHLRENPAIQTTKLPPGPREVVTLPQSPGFHIWHILDFGYLEVGLVQVLKAGESSGYLYENDEGQLLSMTHQCWRHTPPCDETGRPIVDGYRPFNLELLWASGAAPHTPNTER